MTQNIGSVIYKKKKKKKKNLLVDISFEQLQYSACIW